MRQDNKKAFYSSTLIRRGVRSRKPCLLRLDTLVMPMSLTAFPVERAPKPDSSCSLFASSFSLSVFLLSSSPAINSFEALVFPHLSCLALHTSRVSFSKSSWFPNLHLDILLSQQKSQRVKNFSPLEGGNRTQSDPLIALSVSLFLHFTSSASCISPSSFSLHITAITTTAKHQQQQ